MFKTKLLTLFLVIVLANAGSYKQAATVKYTTTNVASVAQCGTKTPLLIGMNNGDVYFMDTKVVTLKTKAVMSCFADSQELEAKDRVVVMSPGLIQKPSAFGPIVYKITDTGLTATSWNPVATDYYLVSASVSPNRIMLIVSDMTTLNYGVFSKSAITSTPTEENAPVPVFTQGNYKKLEQNHTFQKNVQATNLIALDIYDNLVQINSASLNLTYFYDFNGTAYASTKVANVAGGKSGYGIQSFLDLSSYSSSKKTCKFLVTMTTMSTDYAQVYVTITYSTSMVPELSLRTAQSYFALSDQFNHPIVGSSVNIDVGTQNTTNYTSLSGTFYCQDRIFKTNVFSSCLTENDDCIVNDLPVYVLCSKDQSSNKIRLVVVTNYLNDLMNYTFSIYDESGISGGMIALIVILCLIFAIAVGLGVAFFILHKKKGITFKQFITCQCLRKGSQDSYQKFAGEQN